MWHDIIKQEKQQDYFQKILFFLNQEKKRGKIIFPSRNDIFAAFKLTSWDNTKIVILGQDPYPGMNQAHGLAFSVQNHISPPSLQNIFKELKNDLALISFTNNLTAWALEGVLLLNSILTVEKGKSLSHQNIGWENFTKKILQYLQQKENLVYILWGNYAQGYASYINEEKNLILKSAHPSPLSAHRGFFGSRPFSRANIYLQKNKKNLINWNLGPKK